MMTDREAMNELAEFYNENSDHIVLNDSLPWWVWDLVSLVDDLLLETERLADEDSVWGGDTVTEEEYNDWIKEGQDAN